VQGPWLTLLEPEFQGPRTTRFNLGVSHPLNPAAVVHVSGVYRHTDFLPRYSDLNAVIGFTPTARRAGTKHATSVAATSSTAAVPSTTGSHGFTS